MSNDCLDEDCKNCKFHNPNERPLYCDFTGSSIRCNILKKNVEILKFKEKLI